MSGQGKSVETICQIVSLIGSPEATWVSQRQAKSLREADQEKEDSLVRKDKNRKSDMKSNSKKSSYSSHQAKLHIQTDTAPWHHAKTHTYSC